MLAIRDILCMKMLVFLNFPLYLTLQRASFVTKWSVAMKFLLSGLSSAFLNNCLSSSVDHCEMPACGGLGATWWHVGQSYRETSVWY